MKSNLFPYFLFVIGYMLGNIQAQLNNNNKEVELECTCAPCYPEKYCKKCGHKSKECPRLQWYFKPAINSVTNYVKKISL